MHLGCTLRMALLACFIGESVDFGWRGMQVAAKSIFLARARERSCTRISQIGRITRIGEGAGFSGWWAG